MMLWFFWTNSVCVGPISSFLWPEHKKSVQRRLRELFETGWKKKDMSHWRMRLKVEYKYDTMLLTNPVKWYLTGCRVFSDLVRRLVVAFGTMRRQATACWPRQVKRSFCSPPFSLQRFWPVTAGGAQVELVTKMMILITWNERLITSVTFLLWRDTEGQGQCNFGYLCHAMSLVQSLNVRHLKLQHWHIVALWSYYS